MMSEDSGFRIQDSAGVGAGLNPESRTPDPDRALKYPSGGPSANRPSDGGYNIDDHSVGYASPRGASAQDDIISSPHRSLAPSPQQPLVASPSALGRQPSALLLGYGNPYRRDDGVAFHVINAIRARLGRPPLALDDTGEDDLGNAIDTVMAHQLVPEIAPMLAKYARVIFVDAHIGSIPEEIRVILVEPDASLQATTHHFGPPLLLSLAHAQSGSCPQAWLLSIRGDDFDYGETLTESCAARLAPAVDEALRLANATPPPC